MNTHHFALILSLSLPFSSHAGLLDLWNAKRIAYGATAAGLAYGGYKAYSALATPSDFKPNLANLNVITVNKTAIPQEGTPAESVSSAVGRIGRHETLVNLPVTLKKDAQTIGGLTISSGIVTSPEDSLMIFSRGFGRRNKPDEAKDSYFLGGGVDQGVPRNGGGLLQAYKYYRDNIINGTCVIFDYPYDLNYLNFGQKSDQECLEIVYQETIKGNPTQNIVLLALCMGGSTALRWMANYSPGRIKALIVESPFSTMQDVAYQAAKKWVGWLPGCQTIVHNLFKAFFANFKEAEDTLLADIQKLPAELPLLIAHLQEDTSVSSEGMQKIIDALAAAHKKNIYFIVISDPTHTIIHGKLSFSKQFQQTCNAFLAAYNQPHDPVLAQEGKALLAIAHTNAHAKNISEWKVIENKK